MIKSRNELTKRYYTISEVAEMFDVSKSLIRFWDSEFEILKPHKMRNGERRFTPVNIEQFEMIYHLVKEKGFTLNGAKQQIDANRNKERRRQLTVKKLKAVRGFLVKMKKEI